MTGVSLHGRVLAGRYALSRHLADGAMGAVWTARDLRDGVDVAVKVMSVEGLHRPDLRARFEREAKAVAFLQNPHVVKLIDYGTDGDMPFIVMELLQGIDLLAMLERRVAWPLPEVAELIVQVASGLSAAHAAGLIHRDVKPANIFLARGLRGIEAKLLDFGIAKWAWGDVSITAANVVLGSPLYMSPEQIRAQPVDARVDVWALAVVAFRLVAGELPFVGRDAPEIASTILSGARKRILPPAPKALELERFFSRAFATDREMRFRTAAELAHEFILVSGVPSALKTVTRALASDTPDVAGSHPWARRTPAEDSVTLVVPDALSATLDDASTTDVLPWHISKEAPQVIDELSSSELIEDDATAIDAPPPSAQQVDIKTERIVVGAPIRRRSSRS